MVRVRRTSGGLLEVGPGPGRGAWVCAGSPACVEAARRRRAFDRALRGAVEASELDRLSAVLQERARIEG